jgi:hypothetical protein
MKSETNEKFMVWYSFGFDYSFCHPAKERATMSFWRCPKHDNYRGLESMMYAHQESFVCW